MAQALADNINIDDFMTFDPDNSTSSVVFNKHILFFFQRNAIFGAS